MHGGAIEIFNKKLDNLNQCDINVVVEYVVKDFDGKRGRNIAVVYNRKGEWISKDVKLYPFSYAGEDLFYIAGKDTAIFSIEGMTASIFICYDLRFPEAFRRVAKNVQAIFVLANWPSDRREHWETLLKARAIENQCLVIGVNRIGADGNGIHYPGASHIYDPLGNDVCSGSETEEFLMGEFNPSEVVRIRSEYPFLKDMRSLEKCERSKPS